MLSKHVERLSVETVVAMASDEVETSADLSEGEVVDDEDDDECLKATDATAEPESKRRKVQSSGNEDGSGWETLTKRQMKKMAKKKHREKKKYQEKEDKYAASISPKSQGKLLNTWQSEVLQHLTDLIEGKEIKQPFMLSIKTALFQEIISSLVLGTPVPVFNIPGFDKVREDHKVVVVWLSMVSATYFNSSPAHFPRLKKLNPTLHFELQHPGTNRFVKLGLETFMMSSDNHAQTNNGSNSRNAADPPSTIPLRASYLFSLKSLTDNEFPNPSQGEVDQLGRCVGDYVSVREWPGCDVEDLPEVKAGLSGEGSQMPLFAIDCEMVETQNGSELARVSIINEELECIYDTFVKPDCPVVDYRTKYSGITESTLEDVTTTLKDVQEKLAELLPPNSILVGHSLENDFHSMKFRHPLVIDTSCLFTPFSTPTCKPALRKLSKELLDTDIQSSDKGHDSIEDAATCMKLVLLKLKSGASCKISFNEFTPSLLTDFRTKGCATGIVDKESVVRLFGKGSSHSVGVKTDEEAVEKSKEIISLSKFTFIQLHGMEYALKSEANASVEKQLETAEILDKLVMDLVGECPSKTIVFVVLGSGDIRKVRSLQQQDFTDFSRLKKEVLCARTGRVIGFLVN